MAKRGVKMCEKCKRTFIGTAALIKHQVLCYKENVCLICETEFLNPSLLMEHQLSHVVSKKIEDTSTCAVCNLKVPKRHLQLHMKIHDTSYLQCKQCKRRFKGSVGLKMHLIKGCRRLVCKFCKKNFGEAHALKLHQKTHLKDTKRLCPVCKIKVTKSDWSSHMISHRDCKECKKCKRIFKNDVGLKVHMSNGCHKYACKHCKKKFLTTKQFKHHMTIHTGSRRVKCHKCNKTFSSNSSLKRHLRTIHERTPRKKLPKEITCDLCNKVLKGLKFLYKHFAACHKQLSLGNYDQKFKDGQLIKCSLCDQWVKVEDYALHKHMEISEALYVGPVIQSTKCGQCQHSFILSNYKVHLEVHKTQKDFKDDENLWKCVHCRKLFSTASSRKIHQNNCRGGTICVFCGRECHNNKYLEIHTALHTREKPYSCKFCNISFSNLKGLNAHRKTKTHLVNAGLKSCSDLSQSKKTKSKSRITDISSTSDCPPSAFVCCQCEFQAASKAKLCDHVDTCHQIRVPVYLKDVRKLTDDKKEDYQIINGRSRLNTCYLCLKTFFSDFAARDHIILCEFKHGLLSDESSDQEKSLQHINAVDESISSKPCLVLVKH